VDNRVGLAEQQRWYRTFCNMANRTNRLLATLF